MTRTALAALTLGALALLGGCAAVAAPAQPAGPPTPVPSPSARPLDAPVSAPDGLNVRYLDADGSVRTIPVRDFPR